MCWLYGSRYVYPLAEKDPLIADLRTELYTSPYASLPWDASRHWVAKIDDYSPIHPLMKALQNLLAVWEDVEAWGLVSLRRRLRAAGLSFAIE
jgi:hypothetical protein